MPKSKKELLKELTVLEDKHVESIENDDGEKTDDEVKTNESMNGKRSDVQISSLENDEPITRPKKPRSQKQLEVFERAKKIRDENAAKRKEERMKREEEERKILEEKLVKKAISIKKKQIKKQAVLDEISDDDDDTPIQKVKEITKAKMIIKDTMGQEPEKPKGPSIRFV